MLTGFKSDIKHECIAIYLCEFFHLNCSNVQVLGNAVNNAAQIWPACVVALSFIS